jgi:UDP-N-acetylmuramoyl-L-alanyl-D-glutamate--2,6-diaminopimelate ligase
MTKSTVLGSLARLQPRYVGVDDECKLSISGISFDSRKVHSGDAFFCMPGQNFDGNQFIRDAVNSGASLVVTERQFEDASVPQVIVSDVRLALGVMAAEFYGNPSQKMRVIAVTGTNGKTTTTHLVQHILNHAGRQAGLIGTLGAKSDSSANYIDVKHTTPFSSDLQRLLSEMMAANCRHVSMEVSSHALVQKRVAGCEFAIACLTNVTQDHLDFHKTMENYYKAKRLLFEEISHGRQTNRAAVFNQDEPLVGEFLNATKTDGTAGGVKIITYGWNPPSDVHVRLMQHSQGITTLALSTPEGDLDMRLRLTGRFNMYNVMAAAAICLHEGVALADIKGALEGFSGVSGRFEVVTSGRQREPLVVVDYAHTPDGLDNVLKTAAGLVAEGGKLICVFGCGGDRDSSKRPQMAHIAETHADEVIVTSDNPRTEDPQQIIADILSGISRMKIVTVEPDRAAAIALAVANASAKDVVVVAGKGHEDYQILADRTIDFDDRKEVRKALELRPQ